MSRVGFRAHFRQLLDCGLKQAQAQLVTRIEAAEDVCELKSFPDYLCLRIPEADRHFGSPRLTLSLEPAENGGTRVTGIYVPNANLWALFLYGWLIVGSFLLFSGILAGIQFALGNTPWGLCAFCPSAVAALTLYRLAPLGQRLGASQTYRLHHLYESAMGRTEELH